MKSDVELKNSFKIEKQGENLIFVEIIESEEEADDNGRQAEMISEEIMKIVNQAPDVAYNFLVDLTLAGTVSNISPRAREVYTQLSKVSNLNRAAIVGHNLMLEVAVNLLMQATGRSHSFKWFTDKEEARQWLLTSG